MQAGLRTCPNVPRPILAPLEEAIKAHGADCFVAAALMVRCLLEEICQDKKATDGNLQERLSALGNAKRDRCVSAITAVPTIGRNRGPTLLQCSASRTNNLP